MSGTDDLGPVTANGPGSEGSAGRLSVVKETLALIGFLALLLVLVPFALITVFAVFQVWQAAAVAAGGTLLAVVLHRARSRPAFFYAAGVVATTVGWICAVILSGWDLDGRLDDDEEPWFEVTAFLLAIAGGVLGLVFGLAVALRSRGWGGRYAGVAIALLGAFAVAGVGFL
jgi:hypothetical protein